MFLVFSWAHVLPEIIEGFKTYSILQPTMTRRSRCFHFTITMTFWHDFPFIINTYKVNLYKEGQLMVSLWITKNTNSAFPQPGDLHQNRSQWPKQKRFPPTHTHKQCTFHPPCLACTHTVACWLTAFLLVIVFLVPSLFLLLNGTQESCYTLPAFVTVFLLKQR